MVAKALAAACLTRCVETLMEGPSELLPPPRVVRVAHAALRNERDEGGLNPELYSVGCMCLTLVLNAGAGAEAGAAAMVDDAQVTKAQHAEVPGLTTPLTTPSMPTKLQEALGTEGPSLLELFGASLAQHPSSHELCAISLMALRQLLGCWVTVNPIVAGPPSPIFCFIVGVYHQRRPRVLDS